MDYRSALSKVVTRLQTHPMTLRRRYARHGLAIQRAGRKGIPIAASDVTACLPALNSRRTNTIYAPDYGDSPLCQHD
jgi:hypothetical protein